MLPRRRVFNALCSIALLISCAAAIPAQTSTSSPAPPIVVEGLGRGTVALGGPWQFHLGDDLAWANPAFDDSGWEQLSANKPWGMQGHANTEGVAWYRLRVTIDPGQGAPKTLSILLPAVEDAYELYWNGRLVGTYAKMPPHPDYYFDQRPRIFDLGQAKSGTLALRIWKAPFISFNSGQQGGFYAPPLVGGPQAAQAALGALNYDWLRSQLFTFGLNALYLLVGLLSLIAWLRDRGQQLLLWMACFTLSQPVLLVQENTRLPFYAFLAISLSTPFYVLSDISLWCLLLWLLNLRDDRKLVRIVYIVAAVDMVDAILDSFATYSLSLLKNPVTGQIADGILTIILTAVELIPFYLIGLALVRRKQLGAARWVVALFALLTQLIVTGSYAFLQGSRFTHWTLGEKIAGPLFSIAGSSITAGNIAEVLLLISLVFAVYQYSVENGQLQAALQQEFHNARAVQQVLIPEAIPHVPGFALDSIYQPAGEVGGDFFQILATPSGGVLAIIGDVSGKGMPAAMTVSLLVGTVRTLAHFTQSPGAILAAMNQRMLGRSQGGFTTCLVLRADADGKLTGANAGHIAPYLAGQELALENSLPLGLAAEASYTESVFQLAPGQQLTLLTDGIVEAREKTGALFGFERTAAISRQPASQIAKAAALFGQDDDITVLTLTRERVESPVANPLPAPSIAL